MTAIWQNHGFRGGISGGREESGGWAPAGQGGSGVGRGGSGSEIFWGGSGGGLEVKSDTFGEVGASFASFLVRCAYFFGVFS